MLIIAMVIQKDDLGGGNWRVHFDVPDDDDHEGNGSFYLDTATPEDYTVEEWYGVVPAEDMPVHMACTRKYFIDDVRGWKVEFQGQNQIFVVVTKNQDILGEYEQGVEYTLAVI